VSCSNPIVGKNELFLNLVKDINRIYDDEINMHTDKYTIVGGYGYGYE